MADKMELIGLDQAIKNLSFAQREVLPTAIARTQNRTADRVRTLTVRSVSKFMGAKQSAVRDKVTVTKVGPGSIDRGAIIWIKGKRLNLVQFGARQVARGVSAAPWGRRRIFPTTFIANIGGNRIVMVREKRGGRRVGRLPIRPIRGPGVATTAASDELAGERRRFIAEFMPTELSRQLDVLTRRMK